MQHVAPAFAALRRQFPDIRLEVIADTNNHTLPLLESGALDVVLGVLEPTKVDDSIILRQLTTVEHGIVVAASDPLCRNDKVRAEDLVDRNWLFYSDDPETERWLTGYFIRLGFPAPHIAARTTSFSNGLDLVRLSGFVMMAPVRLATAIKASGLRTISTSPAITSLPAGAYLRGSSQGIGAIARFIDLIADDLEKAAGRASAEQARIRLSLLR